MASRIKVNFSRQVRFKRIMEGPNLRSEFWGVTLMYIMAGLALWQGQFVEGRASIFLDGSLFGVFALMCGWWVYQAVLAFKKRKVFYVRV